MSTGQESVFWRSRNVLQSEELGAHARGLMKSMGYTDSDLRRPVVGIANSWNNICPGHFNLRGVAEAVAAGIRSAGGTPVEFGVIGICDGIAQGHDGMRYVLPSRDLIANDIEVMAQAHKLDGLALLGSCDKIVPGMLMAAARLDLPAVFANGGPMAPGRFQGRDIPGYAVMEFQGAVLSGKMGAEDLRIAENSACPTPGSCAMLGTANTMCCLAEAMGLALPGSATIPASDSARLRAAQESGVRLMSLVKRGITAREIISKKGLENAIRVDLAIGGSTNAVVHLLAHEADVEGISLDTFEAFSRNTPHIAAIMPASDHDMVDFHQAGGVQAVMSEMLSLLHCDAMTMTGGPVSENLEGAKSLREDVIRPLSDPFHPTGGVAILRGNLAPQGSLIKTAAVPEGVTMFQGSARVYDGEAQCIQGTVAGEISPGDVVVIRFEGPRGGPGMPEMFTPLKLLRGMELSDRIALVTDGRFSGSNAGVSVGYVSPEAQVGGPLAMVQTGDQISIDLERREVNLEISPEEMRERMTKWTPPVPRVTSGYLVLYAQLASSASRGVILEGQE